MQQPPSSRDLYLRLLRYVRPYWRQFLGGILAMVVLAASETAVPALLKPLLDGSFVEKDPFYIRWMPVAIVLVFILRGLSNFTTVISLAWVANKVILDLRTLMFDRLLLLPTAFYDNHATGNLISKVTYDVNQVTKAATSILTVLVRDTLVVIGLLSWMLYLNWQLSLASFLMIPVVVLVVRFTGKRLRQLSQTLQASVGDMTHVLEESIKGHKIVKIFGGDEYEKQRFSHVANWVRRLQMKIRVASIGNLIVVELIGAVAFAIVVYIGVEQAIENQLTVGGFVSLFTAMGLLFPPIKRLTSINEHLQKGLAASESIFGLIDEPTEEDTGNQTIGRSHGELCLQDVRLRYPHVEEEALKGVSFHISTGQTVALVGSSGSGKTSLAALLPRLYLPHSGTILLDGQDIQDISLQDLRRQFSYVSQDVVLFNDTVAANISYGIKPPPNMNDIRRAAGAAFVTQFVDQMPNGFETEIGENGVRLSGGQRQRIAIARALMKDAPILILDEATSSLDSESERQVQAALEKLKENRTTVVIAHRLSTIEHADEILVMEQGRIIERGVHNELLVQNSHYAELYRKQFRDETV